MSKKSNNVWVELKDGRPIRILRSSEMLYDLNCISMDRAEAVESIRRQIYERSKGRCENECGNIVTWKTGHMHERIQRSLGGEVSLDNSVFICSDCHRNVEHGDRKWNGRR